MKINIGNDIIKTERIEKLYYKYGNKFTNKIFTEKEIKYCESKGINKFNSYAVRFAAKEAIYKAISDYINDSFKVGWTDIEIVNQDSGKPISVIKGLNVNIEVSLSHEKEYAIATAIAIVND